MSLRPVSPRRDGGERDRRRSEALSKANPRRPDEQPNPRGVAVRRSSAGLGASRAQRSKRGYGPCIVTGLYTGDVYEGERVQVDAAHLWPRDLGGCADPDCVVPLIRPVHRAFDAGEFCLLPYLIAHGLIVEMQHALAHADGNLIGLLNRLTGEFYVPEVKP